MMKRIAIALLAANLCGCISSAAPREGPKAMSQPESTEPSKLVVRRFYEEYINQKREDLLASLVAPSFVDHTNGGVGPEGVAAGAARLHSAFENLRFEILDLVADGEVVAVRWIYTGKHVGPFFGRPPTGKLHEQRGANFFRVREGKIAELWLAVDPTSLRPPTPNP
jgi:predicted ester cyclase